MKKNDKKSGFSLVEMLIYVSVLSIISFVIINMLISITSTYRTVVALRVAEQSGIDSMERISRDIRSATVVDTASSVLGTHPGVLVLTSASNGVSTTTRYYLDGGVLKVDVNGVYLGPMTRSNTEVTDLVFHLLDNGISRAVKIDLSITSTIGPVSKTKTYHSTVILKGL